MPWKTLRVVGIGKNYLSHSGVPFSDKDYAGATPPYFSMLQIIALFIVFNTPVAIWRFLDCRLTHSPEILPLLVAAQELRRRKASLLVFPGCAREEAGGWRALTGLSDFLSTCHLPVATMHTLDDLRLLPRMPIRFTCCVSTRLLLPEPTMLDGEKSSLINCCL